ncbi:MAG: glutamate racemase [Myxococcota bacterium]
MRRVTRPRHRLHPGGPVRIGVFDSGIGGLTVLAALDEAVPEHDLIYLGDTARVPYGTRSPLTVRRYAQRVSSYLYGEGVDILVIACNTATAHALPALQKAGQEVGVPVFGVIEPGVTAALAAHQGGPIAVLGTEGTIRGGAYQQALAQARPDLDIRAIPCPLLVPLAEEGWTDGDVPRLVAERYLGHLRGHVQTVILGCTHYPLFRPVLSQVLPGVTLVDSASATAAVLRAHLGPPGAGQGLRKYLVTDHVDRFTDVGERFLGKRPDPVSWVDLPAASGPFTETTG